MKYFISQLIAEVWFISFSCFITRDLRKISVVPNDKLLKLICARIECEQKNLKKK